MLRLAVLQFRPTKGAYSSNLARLGQQFAALGSEEDGAGPPDLIVCPEACLTGYFLEGGVRELALSADAFFADLSRIHEESGLPPVDIVIGFYELWQSRLYNAALAATLGGSESGIRHVHRKVFLPTYGVFDEERFVEPGLRVEAFSLRHTRAAALVCEDTWHSLVPTIAALGGAQLILVPSASPARGIGPNSDGPGRGGGGGGTARPASLDRWERFDQTTGGELGVFVVLALLVGFEGGKGFPGGSIVVGPDGTTLARAPVFEESVLQVTLDMSEIARVRAESPLLSDLQMRLPHLLASISGAVKDPDQVEGGRTPAVSVPVSPEPVAPGRPPQAARLGTPSGTDPLGIAPELTRQWLVEFIRDEVRRRRGFQKVVVGLSGGVDSALVTFLASDALGPENVTAIPMPFRTSSSLSLEHAQLVIGTTGVRSQTVDISKAVDGLADALDDKPDPTRLGNIMARMRMIVLFDRSAALRALPLGTGNKTERLFGYFTWHADDSPPVNPIGDLFKTQVWALARHLGVPEAIVQKPATADLVLGQTDEADIGIQYQRADQILHWLLSGHPDRDIIALGFSAEEVALVRRRVDGTHWKRRVPTVAMLSQTAIGEYYLRPVDF